MRVPFEQVKETIKKAFLNVGLTEEQAEECAKIHTQSSCDGVYSHGLNRVPRFCDYVKKGLGQPQKHPAAGQCPRRCRALRRRAGHRYFECRILHEARCRTGKGTWHRHGCSAQYNPLDARRHLCLAGSQRGLYGHVLDQYGILYAAVGLCGAERGQQPVLHRHSAQRGQYCA